MARPEITPQDTQLTAYRGLLDNALATLKAAREERWDDLATLDAERQGYLSAVAAADLVSTQPSNIKALTEMIQTILECDEQSRSLLRARQEELSELLGSMGNERKLGNAYRSG